jgi:demethylmenaquinone methyltransferase / 2-methoxy-6-polyprenyl-1,4-benzoquinol methylase
MKPAADDSSVAKPTPSRHEVWKMFDRIAHRYDLLNHLLSLNRDKYWRARIASLLTSKSNQEVLDLATGTGDQLVALYQTGKVAKGVGLDLSEKMLEIGRAKLARLKLDANLSLKTGDAGLIPLGDILFDAVTISFGIRNVTDVPSALIEMRRVLRPQGRALILEFSLPRSLVMRKLYLFYFRHILPVLGGMISGDSHAYRYLNQTVETFPYGESFCQLMRAAGFKEVHATPLTLGIATIYQGDK